MELHLLDLTAHPLCDYLRELGFQYLLPLLQASLLFFLLEESGHGQIGANHPLVFPNHYFVLLESLLQLT